MPIDACEPPHHLAVSTVDEHGTWRLEATLAETDGITELTFDPPPRRRARTPVRSARAGSTTSTTSSRRANGAPMPDFEDYFPALKPHFES